MQIYLDYTAASLVDPRVVEAMRPYFGEEVGNSSSAHEAGRGARRALEEARASVAGLIGGEEKGVVFTSGATEANNLALIGTALRNRARGKRVILSAIEHMSVVNVGKWLGKQGFDVQTVPVDEYGRVDPERIREALTDETVLVSVMYANPEVGTVEPIGEIGALTRERDVYLHVDGTAAVGKVPVDVVRDRIDLLTVSSNDVYGPKGMGALYVHPGVKIQPVMLGGGQERGLRSGSENLPGVAGFGRACEIIAAEGEAEVKRFSGLRDHLIEEVLDRIEGARLTGHPEQRLPHHASFRFDYIEGESLVLSLDMEGIAASSGSACSSKTLEPSHVLLALGLKHEEAHGSLVFTLGRWTEEEHIEGVLDVLPGIVERLTMMSPLAAQKEG